MPWALVALLAGAPVTNPNPWEVVRDDDMCTVWSREVPDSPIRQMKVEATVDASSVDLWRVIRDVRRFTEFMPYVAKAFVVKETAEQRWVYQRLALPIVDDRDYTLRSRRYEDFETKVFEVRFWLANGAGPPPVEGVVRVPVVEGGWLFEPVGPESTRVVYWLHTDPGGYVPAWAINFGQKRSLPNLVEAVTNRAKDPKWRPD